MIWPRPVCRLPLDAKHLHRPFNILENDLALILQYQFKLSRHCVVDGARDENAARGSLSLEASCNVHTIAIEIVPLDDQIPEMDSDAEHYSVEFVLVAVRVRDRLLKLDRRAERFHRACELGQHAVTGQLDDAAAIPTKGRFEAVAAPLFQSQQRAALVAAHEPRISHDVGRHNGR
jgi:hypothetical protein